MNSIRSVLPLLFQGLIPIGVSFVPLQASFPSLLLSPQCIVSSWFVPHTPIDVYRHLYKLVYVLHLLTSIGEENDGDFGILKGVEGFGNTQ